jgi:hypothetical protein
MYNWRLPKWQSLYFVYTISMYIGTLEQLRLVIDDPRAKKISGSFS